jgi:hypothetical protein
MAVGEPAKVPTKKSKLLEGIKKSVYYSVGRPNMNFIKIVHGLMPRWVDL